MRLTRPVVTVLVLSVLFSSCGYSSRVIVRPRLLGDTYITKTTPAPIVQATESGTPEATLASETPVEGYIWNDSGVCNIAFELPPGEFYYLSTTLDGDCPQEQSGVENVEYVKKGDSACEVWKPVTHLQLPAGTRSPRLSCVGGRTFALNFTQTPLNGRFPYKGIYYLTVDFQRGDMLYKRVVADWGAFITNCFARY